MRNQSSRNIERLGLAGRMTLCLLWWSLIVLPGTLSAHSSESVLIPVIQEQSTGNAGPTQVPLNAAP